MVRLTKVLKLCTLLSFLLVPSAAQAQGTIDVLWLGGDASYNAAMTTFASGAGSWDPLGDGFLNWNFTIWNAGDATPTFSDYDVFMIGSNDGHGIDYSRVLAEQAAIEAARGNRTFISGQDADFHCRGDQGDSCGFLYNAINWAGSGTGMGIVALTAIDGGWHNQAGSFLQAEMSGMGEVVEHRNDVIIPAGADGYPVNEGLTTAGLSNWGNSSHATWTVAGVEAAGYEVININNDGRAVTLLTASEAGGGTTGGGGGSVVPEPSTTILMATGLVLFLIAGAWRRKQGDLEEDLA
jgi:hypothetical protein